MVLCNSSPGKLVPSSKQTLEVTPSLFCKQQPELRGTRNVKPSRNSPPSCCSFSARQPHRPHFSSQTRRGCGTCPSCWEHYLPELLSPCLLPHTQAFIQPSSKFSPDHTLESQVCTLCSSYFSIPRTGTCNDLVYCLFTGLSVSPERFLLEELELHQPRSFPSRTWAHHRSSTHIQEETGKSGRFEIKPAFTIHLCLGPFRDLTHVIKTPSCSVSSSVKRGQKEPISTLSFSLRQLLFSVLEKH